MTQEQRDIARAKLTKVDEKVTEIALDCIKKGHMPWDMPWNENLGVYAHNFASNRVYKGANRILTWIAQIEGYKHNSWLTFNQLANKMGYTKVKMGKFWTWNDKDGNKVKHKDLKKLILKDEEATAMPVEFWKITIKLRDGWKTISLKEMSEMIKKGTHDKNDFVKFFPPAPLIHYVYNIEQTKLPLPKVKKAKKLKKTEVEKTLVTMIKDMKNAPTLNIDGRNACYSPSKHSIHMPTMKQFKAKNDLNGTSESHYFHTGCHELVHSSGHKDCLNREGITNLVMWGDHSYAEEELVAESGAEMLARYYNFDKPEVTQNTEAYLQSWASKLKKDPKIMTRALRQSSRAVEYILGL